MRVDLSALVFAVSVGVATPAQADLSRVRFKLDEVQANLAVQGIDGWLLASGGTENSVAIELMNPAGVPTELWFFLVPALGQPVVVCHEGDAEVFEPHGAAIKTYSSARERGRQLKAAIAGRKRLAMEYAPKSKIKSLTRVSAKTVAEVKRQRALVVSSARLVQVTKSLWRPEGRLAHYVAAHHLEALIKAAQSHLATEIRAGRAVTEFDLQQRLLAGYRVRGLAPEAPSVAAGPNTADPDYMPPVSGSRAISKGDLVRLTLWARLEGVPRPIYANITTMAYVGEAVPERYAEAFEAVKKARDAALALIKDRIERRRAVKGYEPAQIVKDTLAQAGYADPVGRRAGHSLDTGVVGDGAHLDAGAAKDTRPLLPGSGFTLEPAIYKTGEFGIKTEVNVFLGRQGVEVTTRSQASITPLL